MAIVPSGYRSACKNSSRPFWPPVPTYLNFSGLPLFCFAGVWAWLLHPFFAKTWRELDAVIGLTMAALAAKLMLES